MGFDQRAEIKQKLITVSPFTYQYLDEYMQGKFG